MSRILPGVVVAAAVVASGCTGKPVYTRRDTLAPAAPLAWASLVVVATPRAGAYGAESYLESGRQTAEAFAQAFRTHAAEVEVDGECRTLQCLREAGHDGAAYFVVPVIQHWEDRNTDWSAIPDRVTVEVGVHEASSGRLLASTVLGAVARRMAHEGNTRPEHMLRLPTIRYVDSLY